MDNINDLIHQANFATGPTQAAAQAAIWNQALAQGIVPSSIYPIYAARGHNELPHTFTVPAVNLRGLAYHTAMAAFQAAQQLQVGLVIFELARSEMGYSGQPPAIYASNILAAAIATNWNKPVFIQGDHYQAKAKLSLAKAAGPGQAQAGEVEALKKLILESLNAGFYNIDLDASTLVDLNQPTEYDQQRANFELASELAAFIRQHQPTGVTVSLGGEIGEVGKSNSRPEELEAYMQGFSEKFGAAIQHLDHTQHIGLAKVAIQTGTSHGGKVSSEGKNEAMNVDFELIKNMSKLSREKYGMGGAVQHGASTLPKDQYHLFPQAEAIEIHLATGFQNMIFDHPSFPKELLQEIYEWCDREHAADRKSDQSDAQFHYSTRKKAWGPFKEKLWQLSPDVMEPIQKTLQEEFSFYFKELGVSQTEGLLGKYIKPSAQPKTADDYLRNLPANASSSQETAELAD
jgi:tagatose 1,6-diphosphate aldolase GatY/KbaY